MENEKPLTERFFQIRVPVPLKESVVFGILPILAILAIWTALTWGRTEVIFLPEGDLEGKTPVLNDLVEDGTYVTIPDSALVASGPVDDPENFLSYRERLFSLGNMAARGNSVEKTVRIKLKRGRLFDRKFEVASESAAMGRGGTAVNRKGWGVLSFRYESVESRFIPAVVLPSPMEVVRSAISLWTDRKLALNVGYSFLRVGEGFLAAVLIVFPLGVLMGTLSRIRAMFEPLMVFSGYTPIAALVPLTMLFGTGELQKVVFLTIAFGIYLLPLFVRSIEEVDNVYLQTAYTLGANRFQAMTRVLLGVAMPHMFDAMRMGFGVGWSYIILVEMVDLGAGGLGALILNSQRIGPKEHIFLILLTIVVLAFITDKIWEKVGNWLFPYRGLKR